MFRRQIPSTPNAANASIGGSKQKAEIQAGVELVRKDESTIQLLVDGYPMGTYLTQKDGSQAVVPTPGAVRTSKARGILNAMLSATASQITQISDSKLEAQKRQFDALFEMARTDEQRQAVIEMREAALEGGWMLYQHGKPAVPFASGVVIPVL